MVGFISYSTDHKDVLHFVFYNLNFAIYLQILFPLPCKVVGNFAVVFLSLAVVVGTSVIRALDDLDVSIVEASVETANVIGGQCDFNIRYCAQFVIERENESWESEKLCKHGKVFEHFTIRKVFLCIACLITNTRDALSYRSGKDM